MPGLIALSIDLGGSHATCAVVRGNAILASRRLSIEGERSLARQLSPLSVALRDLLKSAHINLSDCAAVVFGFPGIVSPRENRVLDTNGKFEDAKDVDFAAWSAKEFGRPLLLENDARLALLAESRYGAAQGFQDAVMVTLGTGVGGAALLGGRLLESRHGLAGTIGGHIPVVLGGRRCSCGNLGCAEAEASTAFLAEIYRDAANGARGMLAEKESLGFLDLFNAMDAGDKPAIAAFEHCLRVWSALVVALIHAYDPEVVVFGGSVFQQASRILPHIQQHVASHAWTSNRVIPLRVAALGPDAAVLGAAPLIELHRETLA